MQNGQKQLHEIETHVPPGAGSQPPSVASTTRAAHGRCRPGDDLDRGRA